MDILPLFEVLKWVIGIVIVPLIWKIWDKNEKLNDKLSNIRKEVDQGLDSLRAADSKEREERLLYCVSKIEFNNHKQEDLNARNRFEDKVLNAISELSGKIDKWISGNNK